jgi:hypothetical protein
MDTSVVDLRSFFQGEADSSDTDGVMAAFEKALAHVEKMKGGTLYVPAGEWLVSRKGQGAIILTTPGMRLLGAGMRATRIRVDGPSVTPISVRAPGITIERLTVCGTLDTDHPGKIGISVRRDPTFISIRDVVVEAVGGYGIFFKSRRDDADVFANVTLRNVVINRCGDDGIDFKAMTQNQDRARQVIDRTAGPRALLRNIAIRDHSALYPAPDSARGERGIDARGQLHIHNLEVLNVKPGAYGKGGAVGVAFRAVEDNAPKGRDASWSTLENYYVSRLPATPDATRGGGVKVNPEIADKVFVSNGNVVDLDPSGLEETFLEGASLTVIAASNLAGESAAATLPPLPPLQPRPQPRPQLPVQPPPQPLPQPPAMGIDFGFEVPVAMKHEGGVGGAGKRQAKLLGSNAQTSASWNLESMIPIMRPDGSRITEFVSFASWAQQMNVDGFQRRASKPSKRRQDRRAVGTTFDGLQFHHVEPLPPRRRRERPVEARPISWKKMAAERHHREYGQPWIFGRLSFEELVRRGIARDQPLLDMGCGAGRMGVHVIPHLDSGMYCGFDVHLGSLVAFAAYEARLHDLVCRKPRLMLDDGFRFEAFGSRFGTVLDFSVSSHLDEEFVRENYARLRKVMLPEGRLFLTRRVRLGLESMADLGFELVDQWQVKYELPVDGGPNDGASDDWFEFKPVGPKVNAGLAAARSWWPFRRGWMPRSSR